MTYLICNAHLDPVWLWRWDEGASETLSTFRAAADLLDEYPELIFNHNESLLYEWIEEYDPALFQRIREHVANGRWEIIGGWFLQPDVNLPVGEAIVRQILKGHRYFSEKFGKFSKTANNFDSFGHGRGLVQVLRQCGYAHYITCRPAKNHYDFESPDFIWRGYDGSEILVHRSDENYNSVKGKVGAEIEEWLENHDQDSLFLWGVGNHGGGPSRKDLDDIARLIQHKKPIRHARPSDYFDHLDTANLPVVEEGLNRIIEGCYTSQIRVKQLHRRLENDLLMVERMASHGAIARLAPYEGTQIADAWRDLLLTEFHDALPGTAIQPAEEDTLRTLSHGLEITARLKTKYLFALSAGQAPLLPETVPLLVYNPHPFAVKTAQECAFVLPKQNWNKEFSLPVVYQDGVQIPSQCIREDGSFNMDWCKRVVFEAHLPASSMSRFDVHFQTVPQRPFPETLLTNGNIHIQTAHGAVEINATTGLVDSYQVHGQAYLKPGAFGVEVYEDSLNSWGGPFMDEFCAPIGRFSLMTEERATEFSGVKGAVIPAVRMIEQGQVRTTVEALMEYGHSQLVQRYLIDREKDSIEIRLFLFCGEKEKRMKLCVPTTLANSEYMGQTLFGREKLDTYVGEHVAQYWTCVSDGQNAVTILNDSVYGSDFQEGQARMTLLRTSGYGAANFVLGEPFHEPMYFPRMDQGERRYTFILQAGRTAERLEQVDREAAVLNMPPYALPYCPDGKGTQPAPLIEIDAPNVTLSGFKPAESGHGHIVRVFEAQGTETRFTLTLPTLGIRYSDSLNPFEIRTYAITADGIEPTTMLEN